MNGPDQIDGIRHPRETYVLFGHVAAERQLAQAFAAGRMHHAWMISGPSGIGKATLAYRLARYVLGQSHAPESLEVGPQEQVSRRIESQAHPDLLVVTRGLTADRKNFAAEIRVDDVRRVGSFLGSTAGGGGWRVVIVDQADDLNVNAANGLLKVLEEPSSNSVFLLVTERPQRLPATLRSRCRMLPLRPLRPADVLAALQALPLAAEHEAAALARAAQASEGSVGRAIALLDHSDEVEAQLVRTLRGLPDLDQRTSFQLADSVAAGGQGAFESFVATVLDHAHARATSSAQAEPYRLARWSEVWENVAAAARTADVFNLDRRPFVLSTLAMLAAAAR